MEAAPNDDNYIYRIDGRDNIVSLSDNWLSFAAENNGAEGNCPERVRGASLWDFIDGAETVHLYQIILKEVRSGNKSVRLLFRCDSPDVCRYLQLTVISLADDVVEFRSRILQTEPRETVRLLDGSVERSDRFVRICSVCKKIAVTDTVWEETEVAINTLKLFEEDRLPRLTHGLCTSCFDAAMAEVEKMTI